MFEHIEQGTLAPNIRACIALTSWKKRINTVGLTIYNLFETELREFDLKKYVWEENVQSNFIGTRKSDGVHCFTWQPHGSQFTIVEQVPANAIRFKLKKPPKLSLETALKTMKFDDSWITIE